jgi:uncharacterized membrane protein
MFSCFSKKELAETMAGILATEGRRNVVFSLVILGFCVILFLIPTGFEERISSTVRHARGVVIETNNSLVRQFGIVRTGPQEVRVRIQEGPWKGAVAEAENLLTGKLELDSFYAPGQTVLLNMEGSDDGELRAVRVVGTYRLGVEMWLFALFAGGLILVGGVTGLRALLSFVFTVLLLWKAMIPLFLKGYDPVLISLGLLTVLTGGIIFLVGGCRKRGVVAFWGAFLGLLLTCGLGVLFSPPFGLHGAVRPFAETLLYSGFAHLDLTRLFLAGVFFASSGAVMDLAMDIASAMDEVAYHRRDISSWELFLSGLSVGRAVIGTMTTTLVLAYSGGYLTMLMLFMGQGIPGTNILNLNYVAAEMLHTLAGSIGLLTVAPFTALVGAFLLGEPAGKLLWRGKNGNSSEVVL